MRKKVKGKRRTYRYYDCEWVTDVSLSDPTGATGRPPCNYLFGPHDFWGQRGGDVYYARYTHTHTDTVADRAESLIARMNRDLPKEEGWKSHWVYAEAVRILWERFYYKQETAESNLIWKTSAELRKLLVRSQDIKDDIVVQRCSRILLDRYRSPPLVGQGFEGGVG